MNIVVCIKQVPDTTEVKIDPSTHNLVREGVPSIMNPLDASALLAALRLRDACKGKVILISMGPEQAKKELEQGLAMGADEAYLLCDKKLSGADTLATGYALAGLARRIGYDIILCGNEAVDGCTGQVGPCMGEHLGIPVITYTETAEISGEILNVVRNTGRKREYYEVRIPALICINKKEFEMNPGKRTQEVNVLNADFLNAKKIGSAGSPTKVSAIAVKEKLKTNLWVDYTWDCEKRIDYIMSGGIKKKANDLIRGIPQDQANIIFEQIMK